MTRHPLQALLLVVTLLPALSLAAIECDELDGVVERMLRDHYVYRSFDNAFSQRVLDQLLKQLDPGKLIFRQTDVETLKESIGNHLDIWVFLHRCEFLDLIRDTYITRTEALHPSVQTLVKGRHDFTVDEFYVRAQSRDYLDETHDLQERWRKQIKYQILQLRLTGLADISERLERYYRERLAAPDRLESSRLRDEFLKAFARALDPHSKYYPPENAADIRIALGETFYGIGATLESRNESFFITRLNPAGPAARTEALKPGDQILAVTSPAGQTVEAFGKTLTELVHLIRGPQDTQVQLTVHRQTPTGNLIKKVPITRGRIDPVAAAAQRSRFTVGYTPESSIRVGVVSLSSFYFDRQAQRRGNPDYRSATRDLDRLITELEDQGLDSLILDLRDNGGGILSEAIGITGLFIEKGAVVQKRDAFGDITILRDKDPRIAYEGPLTVIVEPGSASASEIVAGSLQDYRRALIVGTGNTFGKGTVQIVSAVDRNDDSLGSYKLTNALYFLPSGRSPQLTGITPDVLLPNHNANTRGMGHYPFAIPASQLTAVDFEPSAPGHHHRAPLQSRSHQRVNPQEAGHPTPSDEATPELVSLRENDYGQQKQTGEDLEQDKRILNETIRIAYDHYRLLNHLPLRTDSIKIEPALDPLDAGTEATSR